LPEVGEQGRTVWASFDWVRRADPDTALHCAEAARGAGRARRRPKSRRHLVVKTAALDEAIDEWPATALRRAQAAHSATIMASEAGLSLSRITPMPPT
jgi:hypothetical protein